MLVFVMILLVMGRVAALEPLTTALVTRKLLQVGGAVLCRNHRLLPPDIRLGRVYIKRACTTAVSWSRSCGFSCGFYHSPKKLDKLWKISVRKFGRLKVSSSSVNTHWLLHGIHQLIFVSVVYGFEEVAPFSLMVAKDIAGDIVMDVLLKK